VYIPFAYWEVTVLFFRPGWVVEFIFTRSRQQCLVLAILVFWRNPQCLFPRHFALYFLFLNFFTLGKQGAGAVMPFEDFIPYRRTLGKKKKTLDSGGREERLPARYFLLVGWRDQSID